MPDVRASFQAGPVRANEVFTREGANGRAVFWIAVGCFALAGIFAGLSTIWGATTGAFAFVFAALGIVALFLAVAERYRIRNLVRRLQAVCGSEAIVHWDYTPGEWKKFAPDWTPDMPIGEAFISTAGIYFGGDYLLWDESGRKLLDILWEPGAPTVLDFRVFLFNPNAKNVVVSFRVPVPLGKDDEARGLIEKLQPAREKPVIATGIRVLWYLALAVGVVVVAVRVAYFFGVFK